MRNKIIENAIDSVVNASNTSSDFKLAFRQYVKNKFDDNAKESDLKRILTLIEDDEEDIQVRRWQSSSSNIKISEKSLP